LFTVFGIGSSAAVAGVATIAVGGVAAVAVAVAVAVAAVDVDARGTTVMFVFGKLTFVVFFVFFVCFVDNEI